MLSSTLHRGLWSLATPSPARPLPPRTHACRGAERPFNVLASPAAAPCVAAAAPQQRRVQRRRRGALLPPPAASFLPGPSSGEGPIAAEPLPEGLRIEAVPDGTQSDVEYDASDNVVRIPLAATDGGRRTKLVMFTCNKCGGRSARLVNPLAWDKGAVFCQCQQCGVWHMLAANNPKIVEEIRFDDPEGQKAQRDRLYAEARARIAAEEAAATAGGEGSEASSGTAVGGVEEEEGGDGADSRGPGTARRG